MSSKLLPLLLILLVVLPYHPLITGKAIPIPDDGFVSDLADGEFPPRVEAARLVINGESPFWIPGIYTGAPGAVDPFTLAFFTWLPPAMALGWMITSLLAVAALGTYLLTRQLGCSRTGSFFAGFAFSWSGFMVCQLRHLSILGIVAFFPLALFCLEKAAEYGAGSRHRASWLMWFSLIFAVQVFAGFPQTAYICALVYAVLVAARSLWLFQSGRDLPALQKISPAPALITGFILALVIGAIAGMPGILPLWELGTLSYRSGGGTFEWATQHNYWGFDFFTFFIPYINGDVSNGTYTGPNVFWEDYAYTGIITIILAIITSVTARRRFEVLFWALTVVVSYLIVLGNITPVYRVAFKLVPLFSMFRLPTRWLFVVDLGLAVLAGLGLTYLQRSIAERREQNRRELISASAAVLLAAATVIDLVYHNARQNPFADADRWLADPGTAAIIKDSGEDGRVFSPGTSKAHMRVFEASGGWSGDLSRYYNLREILQPNSNLLHGVDALGGYSGISLRWTADLIGDHNNRGFLWQLYKLTAFEFDPLPAFYDWLEALSVRWLILPVPASSDRLQHMGSFPKAELYRLPGTLPRARVVNRARIVSSIDDVWTLVATEELDIRREVLLHDPELAPLAASLENNQTDDPPGEASMVSDRSGEIVVHASAPKSAILLLADTFYPGWEATLDGRPVEIMRANIAHRAVALPAGSHEVIFRFRPRSIFISYTLSGLGILILAAGFLTLRPWKR